MSVYVQCYPFLKDTGREAIVWQRHPYSMPTLDWGYWISHSLKSRDTIRESSIGLELSRVCVGLDISLSRTRACISCLNQNLTILKMKDKCQTLLGNNPPPRPHSCWALTSFTLSSLRRTQRISPIILPRMSPARICSREHISTLT
jgi:hypothetical protein